MPNWLDSAEEASVPGFSEGNKFIPIGLIPPITRTGGWDSTQFWDSYVLKMGLT
jgi:hypothetical protein